MAVAAIDAVGRSIRVGVLIALALGLLFLGAARAAGSAPVAQYGGALWVFMLSLLITLPLLTPVMRKRSGG
ncbi:MAG: hypothetical protein ACRDIC_07035 [bacterium]